MGCIKEGQIVYIKDKECLMRDCRISRLENMRFGFVESMEKYLGTKQKVSWVGNGRVRIRGFTWPLEAIEYKGILSTGERIL